MIPLRLTPYEIGQRSPADYFAPDARRQRKPKPFKTISPAERERRRQLAAQAREQFPSAEAMGRAIGAQGGDISKWFRGSRPVPDRYVEALQRLAGVAS